MNDNPATQATSHKPEGESAAINVCSDCGQQVEAILGCPDGAEVCSDCEHLH